MLKKPETLRLLAEAGHPHSKPVEVAKAEVKNKQLSQRIAGLCGEIGVYQTQC